MKNDAVRRMSDLLHDSCLTLRKGDVSTRFVLDKLDVNLSPLAPGLVVVVIIIIGGSAHARTLDTSSVCTVAIVGRVEAGRVGVGIGDVGHDRLRPRAVWATPRIVAACREKWA